MKKAVLIKANLPDFTGKAHLYRLSEPMTWRKYRSDLVAEEHETEFVVVSATTVPGSGPETYIFPADEDGNVIDWGELDGSFRGALDHEQALRNAGYEVKKEAENEKESG